MTRGAEMLFKMDWTLILIPKFALTVHAFIRFRLSNYNIKLEVAYIFQVWRVNGSEKTFLSFSEQCKFFSGDCYIFQYTYPGENGDECLIGTWFGKKSVQVTVLCIFHLLYLLVWLIHYHGNLSLFSAYLYCISHLFSIMWENGNAFGVLAESKYFQKY